MTQPLAPSEVSEEIYALLNRALLVIKTLDSYVGAACPYCKYVRTGHRHEASCESKMVMQRLRVAGNTRPSTPSAEALDLLQDVLSQACPDGDSRALSAYADGLRYLAEHGRFKIEKEYGRRVIGEFVWPLPTAPGASDEKEKK